MRILSVKKKLSSIAHINDVWEKLVPGSPRRTFPKGRVLDLHKDMDFNGKPGLYYIISGMLRLSYMGMEGEERTLLYAGPGVLLNVPSVLANDFGDSVATCMARTEVAIFDAELLSDMEFARNHPELMINLVHTLCQHLVMHSQRLADASLENTVSRLCRIIRELSQGSSESSPNITQQELAYLLGIHRATLTRAIAKLRQMKVIGKFTKKELQILDPGLLEELAGSRE